MENLKVTVEDLKEYLNKFQGSDEVSLVIVDNKERLHYTLKETIFLKEKPVILANVDIFKSFSDEEREINE